MRTFTVTIDEEKKKKLEEQQQYILKKLKDTDNQEKMVLVGYTIMLLYFCILIMRYALAFYGIQPKVLTNNPMLLIFCSSLPIFLWLYMTKFDFFNYYRRKKFLAYFVMLNMLVTLLQPIYSLTWKYAVRYILKIPLSRTITINMVLGLARMVLAAALALATAIIVIQVQPYIFTPSATEELLYIKWKYLFDTRENHKYAYDLRFIKDLETGKDLLIKEIDRYTHMYITGASGTGKTSSCYNNIILQDLITKTTNRNKRYKELAKMVLSGKAYFKKPFKIFVESYIEPKEEYKAEYDNIYKKYPDCGITVQAPNGSLNDGIIKMAAARKLTVNLIDPTRDKPKYKNEKLIGLNPFSIPLPEEGDPVLTDEVTVLILEKSKIFAQVLAALNELTISDTTSIIQCRLPHKIELCTFVAMRYFIDPDNPTDPNAISFLTPAIRKYERFRLLSKQHFFVIITNATGGQMEYIAKSISTSSLASYPILITSDLAISTSNPLEWLYLYSNKGNYKKRTLLSL